MSLKTRLVSHSLLLATILLCTGLDRPAQAGAGIWTPVGPGASWSRNEITSVTVHPGSPGNVWVTLPHGGLYRSSDKGINWRWAGGPFLDQAPARRPGASRPGGRSHALPQRQRRCNLEAEQRALRRF